MMQWLLGVVLIAAAAAQAPGPLVALRPMPAVRPSVAAMPEILSPRDAAERAINAGLRGLDTRVRLASAPNPQTCPGGSYSRGVTATMRGPGFLSFLVTDETDCGAHPSVEIRSIVYDLKTGKPVDWNKLLPAAYVEGAPDGPAARTAEPVTTVASKRLYELYLAGYPKDQDVDCQQTVRDAGTAPPPMTLWLDAAGDGLAVRFDLPHAVQACAEAVTIPTETMRSDGADQSLTEAIDAAHRAGEGR